MSRIRNSWFQRNAQQGVFMKVANLPPIIRSGAVAAISQNKKPKPPSEKHFVVGKSKVGGEEVVGG